ncbi:amino acid adenylation domain-containing protein [Exilibacterium tricleocarpae]|uniref:Amino acid adenylation domain-containing protein n=1 Tax=Exilibacterium tricleocarpae TaxID=2591008 RepID=A0A545SSR5_9GAMM|nr:non-ribosomal peptide synthetase [Exilibacterium tricleocarpae]TQV68009.1 amino acid adenylation domain-containing protein [Exilibacterium tricleocarpae]
MNLNEIIILLSKNNIELKLLDGEIAFPDDMSLLPKEIVDQVYKHQAEIADWLKAAHSISNCIIPSGKEMTPKVAAASTGQQRLWYLTKVAEPNYVYNSQLVVPLHGNLNIDFLEYSISKIVERHESLRTVFSQTDEGELRQVVIEPFSIKVPLTVIEAKDKGNVEESLNEEIECFLLRESRREYDLEKGPLFRVHVLQLPKEKQLFLLSYHHIVFDGLSLRQLISEVNCIYSHKCEGTTEVLDELPVQYSDFAAWEQQWIKSPEFMRRLSYWEGTLKDFPLLNFPYDKARPTKQNYTGARRAFRWPLGLTTNIMSLAKKENVTLYTVVLAAYKVLLMRYCRQEKFLVGTIIANRLQPEIKNLIGFFVETVVLPSDLSGPKTFRQLLKEVRLLCKDIFYKKSVPFNKLVDLRRSQGFDGEIPICQALLEFGGLTFEEGSLAGQPIDQPYLNSTGIARFDIIISLRVVNGQLEGHIDYNTSLIHSKTAERFLKHYQSLFEAVVGDPEQDISVVPFLSQIEVKQLSEGFKQPQKKYASTQTIIDRFEMQVAKTPDAVAIVHEDSSLTYGSLNKRSNQLAHYLVNQGVKAESKVGLRMARSLETIVGILGILKAGGAYVPIDPHVPAERAKYILQDSGVSILLTQTNLLNDVALDHIRSSICLDKDWKLIEKLDDKSPTIHLYPENLAYIIYTSGSTGKPKGSLVTHANVVRLFLATESYYKFKQSDSWSLFHSFAFDFSVWELWGALLYGGKVIVVPYWLSRDVNAFCKLVYDQRVTVLSQTPSAFSQFISADNLNDLGCGKSALRYVVFGGEALDVSTLKEWFERHGDRQPQLVNMYGITETTVHVTYGPLSTDSLKQSGSLIGEHLSDLQTYVLDKHLQMMPIGIPGELYVGGQGLARGYLNRPMLTAERFVASPFSAEKGGRLYKTGDLMKRLPDGSLEYLGRIDQQVKIRGFRIELGEIQAALISQPGVRDAVVVVNSIGEERRDQYLTAYVVYEKGVEIDQVELRDGLLGLLPDYMIPSFYSFLEALPLTSNGKVDYRALPAPTAQTLGVQGYMAPKTEIEHTLVTIWAEVLELPVGEVGINSSFFELGGHSLLATRIAARIREKFGVIVSIKDMLTKNTISMLSIILETKIEQSRHIKSLLEKSEVEDLTSVEKVRI